MENEFKGTKWPWIADIRGGCAAIYPAVCVDETPGCNNDDSRNIAYSTKGAKFNGMRWEIDSSVEHDFNLMAAAPELLAELIKARKIIEESDEWWMDSPDRGGFDTESMDAAINKALGK